MGDTTIGSLSSNNGTDWKSLAELFGKDKKDLKDMFIYDEDGNIIGIKDSEKGLDKIATEMQGIQMESMKVVHDRFVREAEANAAKNAATAEEASTKQTEVTKSYKDVTDMINALGVGSVEIEEFAPDYVKDANILKRLAEELTKPNASNTAVINGATKFLGKVKDFEDSMNTAKEQMKETENEEAGIEIDAYYEAYKLETYETENFFTNQSWISAYETTEVEEDDMAVA